jgi:glycerol-3-phosphate acyltransferase PlsY
MSVLGFLSGSIPYSVLLGRWVRGVDIRQYGDANPGATNVLRAAGWRWGLAAMLLDGFKGAIPVGLSWFLFGIRGWQSLAVALAPVLGHALSPWLRGRGGKAVAVTFGIWAGLTIGAGPTILGLLLGVMYSVIRPSGWAVMSAFLLFGLFVIQQYSAQHPEMLWIWLGNLIILAWRHHSDIVHQPALRHMK